MLTKRLQLQMYIGLFNWSKVLNGQDVENHYFTCKLAYSSFRRLPVFILQDKLKVESLA